MTDDREHLQEVGEIFEYLLPIFYKALGETARHFPDAGDAEILHAYTLVMVHLLPLLLVVRGRGFPQGGLSATVTARVEALEDKLRAVILSMAEEETRRASN